MVDSRESIVGSRESGVGSPKSLEFKVQSSKSKTIAGTIFLEEYKRCRSLLSTISPSTHNLKPVDSRESIVGSLEFKVQSLKFKSKTIARTIFLEEYKRCRSLPSTINHQPSTIIHQPSTIIHQPLAPLYNTFPGSDQITGDTILVKE